MSKEKPASWVIVSRKTGEGVFETFEEKTAKAINKKKYKAVPIMTYLTGLNWAIKEGYIGQAAPSIVVSEKMKGKSKRPACGFCFYPENKCVCK